MKLTLAFILIFIPILLFSQSGYVPFNNDACFYYDRLFYAQSNSHPSIKPYKISEIKNITEDVDIKLMERSGFLGKLTSKDLIYSRNDSSFFSINPVINSFFGGHSYDAYNYNSIGFNSTLCYKNKLFGHIYYDYTTAQFTENNLAWINYTDVVPGKGVYIDKDYNNRRLNYLWLNAAITYAPSKHIDFQFGKDKNFLGDGYRSLLLSDNSDSYPFLKATVNIWKVKYLVLYNIWKDVDSDLYDNKFYRKYATTHYLSWNIWPRLNLNLFETVIWRGEDSLGTRGYDVNYMNPVIFFRPVEFSLGSPDNVIMGGGFRLKLWENLHIYHQTVLDEFKLSEIRAKSGWWANKYGFQFGLKAFDLFKMKGLYTQLEYNIVRPFTYSHRNTLENYGHHYQAMAHPLGANFVENVLIIRYHKKRFYSSLKILNADYGEMQDTINTGNNIYLSYLYNYKEYGNTMLQGRKCNIFVTDLRLGWMINPKWNLSFETGVKYWKYDYSVNVENRAFLLFGIKTNIYNTDIDY